MTGWHPSKTTIDWLIDSFYLHINHNVLWRLPVTVKGLSKSFKLCSLVASTILKGFTSHLSGYTYYGLWGWSIQLSSSQTPRWVDNLSASCQQGKTMPRGQFWFGQFNYNRLGLDEEVDAVVCWKPTSVKYSHCM